MSANVSRMLSATSPSRNTIASTAAAPTTSPVADSTSKAVKLPRTRNAVESGRRCRCRARARRGTRRRTPRSRASWREGRTASDGPDRFRVPARLIICCPSRHHMHRMAGRTPKNRRRQVDPRRDMSHRGWINFTRAGSAVGLAAFALFILAAPDDSTCPGSSTPGSTTGSSSSHV